MKKRSSNKRKQNPEYGYSIDSLGHGESNEHGLAGPTHNFNNASRSPFPLPNATPKLADHAIKSNALDSRCPTESFAPGVTSLLGPQLDHDKVNI